MRLDRSSTIVAALRNELTAWGGSMVPMSSDRPGVWGPSPCPTLNYDLRAIQVTSNFAISHLENLPTLTSKFAIN